jgi:hypothetical protein
MKASGQASCKLHVPKQENFEQQRLLRVLLNPTLRPSRSIAPPSSSIAINEGVEHLQETIRLIISSRSFRSPMFRPSSSTPPISPPSRLARMCWKPGSEVRVPKKPAIIIGPTSCALARRSAQSAAITVRPDKTKQALAIMSCVNILTIVLAVTVAQDTVLGPSVLARQAAMLQPARDRPNSTAFFAVCDDLVQYARRTCN